MPCLSHLLSWPVQVLWRVAGTLEDLMDEWRGLLLGGAASQAPASETGASAEMDIARVEGFAVSILCHTDVHVRNLLSNQHSLRHPAPAHRSQANVTPLPCYAQDG